MDLAAKYNIKTIIAEISHSIPEWVAAKHPELLPVNRASEIQYPRMGGSTATGGFNGGLCLDNSTGRELTGNFLTKLAEHYRGHPALLGYDVQNECNFSGGGCYCTDTIKTYQEWLKNKYGSLENLKESWRKYSYTSFEEIRYPETLLFFPECSDWLVFQHDNFHKNMNWKIEILRKTDSDSLISAHGIAASFRNREQAGTDDWAAGSLVELYGFTWVPCRNGNEPWRLFSAADVTRAGAKGKPFWHAEAQGGHLWLQPQLKGRSADDGRIADEKDLRIWNFISIACGARGILYPRHRPLLDGPLFGAFASYEMDGSRTPRSQMASNIAKWANAEEQEGLMGSVPEKGQIGILYVPECSTASFLHAQSGNENRFYQIMSGAWQGFFDNNIQADFVHIDDIDEYKVLYFPYPISITKAHAEKITAWVSAGGSLVAEACPAYWGDSLHAGTVQPNYGLDTVFGARQKRVEFMPDILTDIQFEIFGNSAAGEGFLQTYELKGGTACAYYQGDPIVVSNIYGKGKTLLIGAFLSSRYFRCGDKETAGAFRSIFGFSGQKPVLTLSDNLVRARLSRKAGVCYLWLLNTTREDRALTVFLPKGAKPRSILWEGGNLLGPMENTVKLQVNARDALILELCET
jgi:beta-galactosidase